MSPDPQHNSETQNNPTEGSGNSQAFIFMSDMKLFAEDLRNQGLRMQESQSKLFDAMNNIIEMLGRQLIAQSHQGSNARGHS